MSTVARVAWACRRVLVSASCTIRYTDTSTPGGSGRSSPLVRSVTVRPAARTSSSSVERLATPGCGTVSGSSSPRRRTPSRRRISVIATRPVASTCRSASRADLRLLVEDPLRGAGLDHDDAQVVGDDVVQLSRDPGPFLGSGLAERRRSLALDLARPSLVLARLEGPRAKGVAGQPDPRGEREDEQEPRVELALAPPQPEEQDGQDGVGEQRTTPIGRVGAGREDGDEEGQEHGAGTLAAAKEPHRHRRPDEEQHAHRVAASEGERQGRRERQDDRREVADPVCPSPAFGCGHEAGPHLDQREDGDRDRQYGVDEARVEALQHTIHAGTVLPRSSPASSAARQITPVGLETDPAVREIGLPATPGSSSGQTRIRPREPTVRSMRFRRGRSRKE